MHLEDQRWQAVVKRDQRHPFFYGVTSTKIYCRPACASRRPKREHVRFFDLPAQAEAAGFRACKRCKPTAEGLDDPNLTAIEKVCRILAEHLADGLDGPPTLAALAGEVGLSPHHLQRRFTKLIGVSPRQYFDGLRLRQFKAALKTGDGVAAATYDAGFGSASRVYENVGRRLGMTPAAYAKGGRAAEIRYSLTDCRLGRLLVAATDKGIAAIALGGGDQALIEDLEGEFPRAELSRDDDGLGRWVDVLTAYLDHGGPHPDLPLDIRATAFQQQVYGALLEIPYGETRSYADIARAIGKPNAVRAVARACATNPAALAIPCHRVIGSDGSLRGYRWDLDRKQALLEMESAKPTR